MKRKTSTHLSALALTALLGATATAQVTTPPPKAADEGEAYTPPPKRSPVRANQPANNGRGQVARAPVPRHDPLAKIGEDGYIIRLDRNLDEVAIERNPYIGDSKNKGINDLRLERRARMERQVIENVDLLVELDSGVIDEIKLTDIDRMQAVAQMIQPLIAEPSLSHELRELGVFTRIQAESNGGIVRQYQTAINEELKQRHPDDHLDHFMRFIMHESVKDARLAYADLLKEGASQIGKLRELDMSPNAAQAIKLVSGVDGLREALAALPVEDHQSVLNSILAMRENPAIPPLEAIDFAVGKTTQKTGETTIERNPDGSIKVRGGELKKDEDTEG